MSTVHLDAQLGQTPAVQHTRIQVCLQPCTLRRTVHLQSLLAHGMQTEARVPGPTAHPRRPLDRLPTSA